MTQTITYAADFVSPAWTEELTTARRDDLTIVERAEFGDVGFGSLLVDDPDCTVGHDGDEIRGLKTLYIDNDAMAPARLFQGFTFDRRYRRGPYRTGVSRQILMTLHDGNAILNDREIVDEDGDRPEETVSERIAWLLASDYNAPPYITDDMGWVDTFTDVMDANDYRGQFLGDVLKDCAEAVEGQTVNWWVRWSDYTDSWCLWFQDSNTSTDFECTLRISNVIADQDGSTLYPSLDAELVRTPENVGSKFDVPYQSGHEYVTRSATAATFRTRDKVAANANIKTAAAATRQATRLIGENKVEDDHVSVTVEVPEAQANDIQAGMRIECKFSHFPLYAAFSWFRITTTQKTPIGGRGKRWRIALELSPQETFEVLGPCGDILAMLGTVYADPNNTKGPSAPDSGGWGNSQASGPLTNVNDDDDVSSAFHLSDLIGVPPAIVDYLDVDLSAPVRVTQMSILGASDHDQYINVDIGESPTDVEMQYSDDGNTWVTAAGSFTAYGTERGELWKNAGWYWNPDTPITARYWRTGRTYTTPGLTYYFPRSIATWEINGCVIST